jgi:hypothetical protein
MNMDDTTLERLMMDEALGALSPDVSMLLAAYTQTTGDARVAQWRRVANLAGEAMGETHLEPLPAFPGQAPRQARMWNMARLGLAAAAVLAVGIGIGSWMPSKPAANVSVAQAPVETPRRSMGVSDFWSSQRLLASAMESAPRAPSRPQWTWSMIEARTGGLR